MDLISILILLAAIFVGWSIGANSASNAIGTLVGPMIIDFRTAAILVAISMLMGALLQSGAVIKTIGEDIIPREDLEGDKIVTLSALLATAIFVGLVTSRAIPVSASHAIVGALVGSGISIGILKEMNIFLILKIFLSWFLTPIFSLILAFMIYEFFMIPISKRISLVTFSETFRLLVIIGTVFIAYGLGANNVGNSAGLVIGSNILGDRIITLIIMGIAMGLGIISFSKKVVNTVGRNITLIDPMTAFTAQSSAGIVIYFFTLLGIPISATQAIIGGLVGAGITKGSGMVNNKLVMKIFIGWIITPFSAAVLSILIYKILMMF
ncbi:MAG TPA: inorganic phosphate transporter [Candidatus Altiarchaeales archaeon]|nr:inorganic phosphate transporter [Candidatus Altiarchaeales archaeon]